MDNKLIVTAAPHITGADSTQKIMGRVCLALVPTLIASILIFGVGSLIVTAVTVAACVFFEWAYCKLMKREVPIADLSAVVTGLLLAFNMPATLPWWMAVVGAFIAIVIIKQLFGGLGYNFANPAIVGRIALAVGFGAKMSAYPLPENGVDALTSATPLAVVGELGSGDYLTLLLGNHGGVLGETCAITILIGGIYLIGPHRTAAVRRPDAGRVLHGYRLRDLPHHRQGKAGGRHLPGRGHHAHPPVRQYERGRVLRHPADEPDHPLYRGQHPAG